MSEHPGTTIRQPVPDSPPPSYLERPFSVQVYQSGVLGGLTHHFYYANQQEAEGVYETVRKVVADRRARRNETLEEIAIADDFGRAEVQAYDISGVRFVKIAELHAWGLRTEIDRKALSGSAEGVAPVNVDAVPGLNK